MAIKAHLDQTPINTLAEGSQRSAPRRALWLETSGFFAGTGEANVTIHNISAAGLLLETGLALAEGEQLALDLPEAGAVVATVVWRSEHLYGCAFAAPLTAAQLAAAQLQGFAPGVPTRPQPAGPTGGARQPGAAAGEGLGTRLNRLRREAGLTLADVAARLGVSKPTVWAWEKGKARPLPERLGAIAEALGIDADLLAAAPASREIEDLIADCRARIAEACGTTPEAVRIMIEL
ncbi:helix-turn-helix domain-containing protein [Porphyrobacter sp. AAP82]|uniref:helix-turn-helix domain-containing protein n=1 Tax=Porphyrobacter sp. AAP82 TaxID=1248917 RepID=UPI0003180CE4|nr:helix-turn-helix domain-containing protein [Porphyrobacter sp. AAP82]